MLEQFYCSQVGKRKNEKKGGRDKNHKIEIKHLMSTEVQQVKKGHKPE